MRLTGESDASCRDVSELVTQPPIPPEAAKVSKERLTVHVGRTLVERLRNAAYWTPGLTLSALAEQALEDGIARLERERGGPFPCRHARLRAGRPPG